jgi:hypothetical protein
MTQTFAGKVFDFYSDALSEGVGADLLEKVGEVSILDPEELTALPDNEFAFVAFTKTGSKRRHYPVNDEGNTKLSMHYYEKFASSLSPQNRVITGKILFKAALRHGVDPSDYVSKIASMETPEAGAPDFETPHEKVASSYALDWNVGFQNMKAFPLDTKELTKLSDSKFSESWKQLPAVHRRPVAIKIAEACEAHGVYPCYQVEKYASEHPSTSFMAHVEARKAHLRSRDDAESLDKLAMASGSFGPELTARSLYEFDKVAGLDGLYDHTLADPWAAVYGFKKEAQIDFNGKQITADALISLIDSGRLDGMFDEDMIEEMRQDPLVVFESLPVPTKESIASML